MEKLTPVPEGAPTFGPAPYAQTATTALSTFFALYLSATRAVEIAQVELHLQGAALGLAMLAPALILGLLVVASRRVGSRAWSPFIPPASAAVLYADHVSRLMAACIAGVALIAGLVAAWYVVDRRIKDIEQRSHARKEATR